jgi:hypothetical protein
MSAHSIVGIESETATKLDDFWGILSLEHRAALHTAFNMADKREGSQKKPNFMLANAESGSRSISSVLGSFLYFMASRVETCNTAVLMMQAILDYAELSPEEQVQKLHQPA